MLVGTGIGISIVACVLILRKKNALQDITHAKETECIHYFDVIDYYRTPLVQKKLAESKSISLFAEKKIVKKNGKQKILVKFVFFDADNQKYETVPNAPLFLGEKIDDILKEKFKTSDSWLVTEEIL